MGFYPISAHIRAVFIIRLCFLCCRTFTQYITRSGWGSFALRRTFESTGLHHQKIKGEWGYERVTLSAGSYARNESEIKRQGENVQQYVRSHGLFLNLLFY